MIFIDIIPYIVVVMIAWDLSLHIFDLLIKFNKTKVKHPFGAYLILDRLGRGDPKRRMKARSVFWTIYWSIAFLLLLIYILAR